MKKIFVTSPFLPPKEEYDKHISDIFATKILTNQGPKVLQFENLIKNFLNVPYFQYVTNGTIALQIALKALDIDAGEIITTPFSYVATSSSILWERCTPVFVDIEPHNFTIDASKIENAITKNTKAILAVHVFGYACDVEKIAEIATKHKLKVIYDGAHAFASRYKGKSLLSYGDISTCSFHATKLFHTIEGGACITNNKNISDKLDLIKRFGHKGDNHSMLGINAKQSEFNASMGLSIFPYLSKILEKRKTLSDYYTAHLAHLVQRPKEQAGLCYNYAYYPIVLESEIQTNTVIAKLEENNIFPRRYFFPSLNTLPYIKANPCPLSESITKKIICLPLFYDLEEQDQNRICSTIIKAIS